MYISMYVFNYTFKFYYQLSNRKLFTAPRLLDTTMFVFHHKNKEWRYEMKFSQTKNHPQVKCISSVCKSSILWICQLHSMDFYLFTYVNWLMVRRKAVDSRKNRQLTANAIRDNTKHPLLHWFDVEPIYFATWKVLLFYFWQPPMNALQNVVSNLICAIKYECIQ